MKNFYLVQAGCLYGNTYYLPYAVGMLAAYALHDERVKASYTLKRIVFSLEDIDKAIDSFDNPALVGFSNSIWNYKYNLEFAEKLKAKYPDCVIEFGGHHVPPDTSLLENYGFIDILCHGKGEEAFRGILLAADGKGRLSDIPNISYRDGEGNIIKTPEKCITISDYPSPYLTGIFDDIIQDSSYAFSCVLETNRGCPYSCSYCDWGELNSTVRLFDLEKVFAELDWMSRNKMEFVYCVDANFGMFERDEQIAQKLVDLKNTTGYPNRLQVSYAKAKPERVFRINKLLADNGIGKGATMSLQSLNPEVLRNVGRVNMSKEEYARQLTMYHDAQIPTYTELILGLPGETRESFSKGLCELLELGQHGSVSAYYCELLPNAEMNQPEYRRKYNIQTVSTALNQYHCEVMDDVLSGASHIVVGTSTMSVEEWIEANVFSTCVQSFHHFGLLQCAALYIRHEYGVSYYDFYSAFLHYIHTGTVMLKALFREITEILKGFTAGTGGLVWQNDVFGKITYPIEEAVFLSCIHRRNLFYEEANTFLKRYIPDEKLLNELLLYQKSVMMEPLKNHFENVFSYDFKSYFDKILSNDYAPLKNRRTAYRYSSPFDTKDWEEYAKIIIWFGRRNGRMLFSNHPNTITEK